MLDGGVRDAGTISIDAATAARARARLALRAEKAWGAGGVIGITLPGEAADQDEPAPAPRQEFARPRPPMPVMRSVEAAPSRPAASGQGPGAPPADLFGGGETRRPAVPPSEEPAFSEPPPPRERRIALLQALDAEQIKACSRCTLCETRKNTVFGEGDPEARLMFIGEGPGETEDATGRPFVGRAGELLDRMIAGMGLRREQVYIANVVKCRPPNNRVPTAMEVAACTPFLHEQIGWIRPQVIVTLGLPATRHLLKSTLSMGALRGKWNQWRGIKVMPTYHPAYLLRSYTPQNRKIVWGDLQQVMAELGLSAKARSQ